MIFRGKKRWPNEKEITFEGWTVPKGFLTDGCTCSPDKPLGYDIRECCILHDWLRRHVVHYGHITVSEADKVFRRFMKAKGVPSWLATIYWLGVKIMRPFWSRTAPVKPGWFRYTFKGRT